MEFSIAQIIRAVAHRPVLTAASLCLLSTTIWTSNSLVSPVQTEPDDADALRGVTVGKVVFDINPSDPETLAGYLEVIEQTHADLLRQKVSPDIILAVRGIAVTFISTERERFDPSTWEQLDAIAKRIRRLLQKGVRLESCAIAMRWYQVDQDHLLDGVTTVGNTFVSLTAYQMKGYAVIPIY